MRRVSDSLAPIGCGLACETETGTDNVRIEGSILLAANVLCVIWRAGHLIRSSRPSQCVASPVVQDPTPHLHMRSFRSGPVVHTLPAQITSFGISRRLALASGSVGKISDAAPAAPQEHRRALGREAASAYPGPAWCACLCACGLVVLACLLARRSLACFGGGSACLLSYLFLVFLCPLFALCPSTPSPLPSPLLIAMPSTISPLAFALFSGGCRQGSRRLQLGFIMCRVEVGGLSAGLRRCGVAPRRHRTAPASVGSATAARDARPQ